MLNVLLLPSLGAATLLVTFEQPMSARGGTITPGEVRPLGVQSERGYIEVVKDAVEPWTAPHAYLNFADTRRDPATFWAEQAHRRLARIKQAVDPGGLVRSNHPVR